MHEFFISPKMAKRLQSWTACTIAGLSVACVVFDRTDEGATQVVMTDSQYVREITSEIQKTNILLKDQSMKIGEMNNSLTGIFGIAKGTLEISPSVEPSINIQPGRPRPPKKPQKDTSEVVTTVNTNDSIMITINYGDNIASTPPNEANLKPQTRRKCCCCNCDCNGCRKEVCK